MNGSQKSRFKLIAAFLTVGIISLIQPGCDCSSSSFTTAPSQPSAIVSIAPANDSQAVLVGSKVSVVFRDEMDSTTIGGAFTLKVSGGTSVVTAVIYDATSKTATLSPATDLLPGTLYIATIASSVKDINGNSPLSTDFVWSFTTASGVQLVSKNTSGAVGNNISQAADIDATGRYIVFESKATNLVSVQTTSSRSHIYRKDMTTGEVVLVSSDASGLVEANNPAANPSISSNGRYVVFESTATNLVTNIISPGTSQIYLKDLQDGSIDLVSRNSTLAPDNGPGAKNARISNDGRYVVFESAATNLSAVSSGGIPQIYRKDMSTETVEMISRNVSNVAGDGASTNPDMSADGTYIVFESVAGNFSGSVGFTRIYLVDTSVVHTVVQVSVATGGAEAAADSNRPSVSDDGSAVVFHTADDALDALDTNGFVDVYVRNRSSVTTTSLVSINQAASNGGNGNSSNAKVSGNGNYVVFESLAADLVSGDTAGIKDIFVRNLSVTSSIVIDRVNNPDSGFEATLPSDEPVISTDGRYVGFHSAEPYTAEDVNTLSDVFRAYNSTSQ